MKYMEKHHAVAKVDWGTPLGYNELMKLIGGVLWKGVMAIHSVLILLDGGWKTPPKTFFLLPPVHGQAGVTLMVGREL